MRALEVNKGFGVYMYVTIDLMKNIQRVEVYKYCAHRFESDSRVDRINSESINLPQNPVHHVDLEIKRMEAN